MLVLGVFKNEPKNIRQKQENQLGKIFGDRRRTGLRSPVLALISCFLSNHN